MKPLKILLGNNTLSMLAGSETWVYTLAIQLKKMGHEVSCFAGELGIISEELEKQGIHCYKDLSTNNIKQFSPYLEEEVKHDYDVIISNHFHIVEYLRSQFPTKPIISTIHGILHGTEKEWAPEHPALNSGVAQFVSVSEEVQEKLRNDYGLDSIIIRNFFDTEKFGKIREPNDTPKMFLVNTNYQGKDDEAIVLVKEVAKHFGAKVSAVGQNFIQQFDLTKAIEDADVVFGMGRSVLEGVAAGRLGIVHGRWGTGGVINENNIDELRHYNFSGRNSEGKLANKEELIEMIESNYGSDWGKKYTAQNHNVVLAAEEYIRIARELTGQNYSKSSSSGDGVDPLAHKFKLAKDVN
jgi:hypothetical protein